MVNAYKNETQASQSEPTADQLCRAPVTLFALPKPFVGDSIRIQRNAFLSWQRLQSSVDVLLLGDEEGIEEFATENGFAYGGGVDRNEDGTPLVSSAFAKAHEVSASPILVYCNSDVILERGFVRAMQALADHFVESGKDFLAIGHRTDLAVERDVDFSNPHDLESLMEQCRKHGTKSSAVCKEYFAFRHGFYQSIPPFAVGRGNWDNWMVAHAHQQNIPVVDISEEALAIHQSHDYSHAGVSRMACYVNGKEARQNQRLAGGRNLVSGSTANYLLSGGGIKRMGVAKKMIRFLQDVPRFSRLMTQLLVQK